ncbi:MAG: hypothetical protein M1832_001842 [Thelocarpon impressellum]|nr:MAG: hypothetical protein M1832_001842 [Thelocarpon impressellum]
MPYDPTSYQSRRRRSSQPDARNSVSTASTFISPVSPTFDPLAGLAPRPPSPPDRAMAQEAQTEAAPRRRRESRGYEREVQEDDISLDAPPTVPDAPRAPPPVSYRDPYANGAAPAPAQAPSRSASGRRRSSAAEPSRDDPSPRSRDTAQTALRNQPRSTAPKIDMAAVAAPETEGLPPPKVSSTRADPGRRTSSSRNNGVAASPGDAQRRSRRPAEPVGASAQQRREWAPDRSPLQKLELTLQDITKEEKRAQVEEAELLARETRAGRGSRRAGRRADSLPAPDAAIATAAPPPDHLAEAGLVRGLSHRQKDRIQRTATVDTRKPREERRLEGEGGSSFEYHEQQYQPNPAPPASRPPRDRLSREVPPQQQQLYAERIDRSQTGRGSPPPKHGAVHARNAQDLLNHGPKHGPPSSGRPHLSDFLPHRRKDSGQAQRDGAAVARPRQLEEWRQARPARVVVAPLTSTDDGKAQIADDKAWWERNGPAPGGAGRSAGTHYADPMSTYDGEFEQDQEEAVVPDHPPHLRQRSRKADQSMRPVRARSADVPTTFIPPLYLKCGPLLRYTGIYVEAAAPGAVEREIWRGSVMIVTADSDSSYETPPTLRLFLQSMELLPPPPAQVGGEGGELPPEHVDPIAGLPSLSRTGQTVYVKAVYDLEEEKDLSKLENDEGLFEQARRPPYSNGAGAATDGPGNASSHGNGRIRGPDGEKMGVSQDIKGVRLHAERGLTFWRFNVEVELGDEQARVAYRINRGPAVGFWVPARGETMNIMFHSCNGFSLSVDPDRLSGPDPLWRDVLNTHQTRPFHVMIGGGDQIYNDAVMKQTTIFQEWLSIRNPRHKHNAAFTDELLEELETFYLERYSMWFSQGLFGLANSQIPMVNLWDDHDIIDGYGSYPHHFMDTPVFRGLGAVAFKYYMLFQHQSVPAEMESDEPSWLLGARPGPYIGELSRSVFMTLGRKVAFLGLDCRTERMRDEVVSAETYDRIFERCKNEIVRGETKHLIVLLGIPIAYPRLVWLESILTSRLMDPIKALGRSGMLGGFLNQFDGGVEILDDLDDHWTAKSHKQERGWLIQELQELAAGKSVRVTILGGDVHLAAVGQFYSNPKLGIPKDRDHRYMPNVVSSAIVNTPPPEMMGDILNKRNKVHHLDHETDEDMIPLFTHDVDGKPRNNRRLLPRRNWCSIREYAPGATPPQTPTPEAVEEEEGQMTPPQSPPQSPAPRPTRGLSFSRAGARPISLLRRLSTRGPPSGQTSNGSGSLKGPSARRPTDSPDGYFPPQSARSASSTSAGPRPGLLQRQTTGVLENKKRAIRAHARQQHISLEDGLDVVLNMEVSAKDPAGITMPYRLLVPALWYEGPGDPNTTPLKRRLSHWVRKRSGMGKKEMYSADEDDDTDTPGTDTDQDRRDAADYAAAVLESQSLPGQAAQAPNVSRGPVVRRLAAGPGYEEDEEDEDEGVFPRRLQRQRRPNEGRLKW